MENRGECQETYYNVARVMHQLSLFDLAANFYRKCLTFECKFENEMVGFKSLNNNKFKYIYF